MARVVAAALHLANAVAVPSKPVRRHHSHRAKPPATQLPVAAYARDPPLHRYRRSAAPYDCGRRSCSPRRSGSPLAAPARRSTLHSSRPTSQARRKPPESSPPVDLQLRPPSRQPAGGRAPSPRHPQSEVDRELKGSMGNAGGALRAFTRQSHDESGENVAVNLVVSSPVPVLASRRGVSTSHAGAHTSPIDVEALDDGGQAVPASQVPALRRSRRTRRAAVPAVDEQVHAPRRGYKRQRVAAVTNISEETGEGSSLKVSPKEAVFTCPVCWDALDEPATTTCGHIFCTNCIKQAIQAQKKCPTCRKKLKMTNFHRIYLPDKAT